MKEQGDKLSDPDKRGVAEFMSGRPLGSAQQGDAKNMPNKCRSNPALSDPARGAAWNGWGADMSNARFQPAQAAGLTLAEIRGVLAIRDAGQPPCQHVTTLIDHHLAQPQVG